MSNLPEIKPAWRIFADEWLTGKVTGKRFNGEAALMHAGFSEKSKPYASRLLRHPAVQEYIRFRVEEMAMGANEILLRFTEVARSNVGDVVKLDPTGKQLMLDPDAVIANRSLIKQFGFDANGNPKIEFHDPMAALQQMARIRGMLKDGLELSGPGGGGVPVTMTVQFVHPDGSTGGPVPNTPQLQAPEEDFSIFETDDGLSET